MIDRTDEMPLVPVEGALRNAFAGKRIVVTRSAALSHELVERVEQLGAEALRCPAIAFEQVDDSAARAIDAAMIATYDWVVLTSVNATNALAARIGASDTVSIAGFPSVAAVGAATAAAATAYGWPVRFAPSVNTGAELVRQMPLLVGQRVLLPRADIATPEVPQALRLRGAQVHDVVLYRTTPDPELAGRVAALSGRPVDAVTFASPSAVQYFITETRQVGWDIAAMNRTDKTTIACIGSTTAAAARRFGLRPAVSGSASIDGIIHALALAFMPIPEILFSAGRF